MGQMISQINILYTLANVRNDMKCNLFDDSDNFQKVFAAHLRFANITDGRLNCCPLNASGLNSQLRCWQVSAQIMNRAADNMT